MPLPPPDEVLATARRLVEASPADETEVQVECEVDAFARYAPEGPTQCGDRERRTLAVRVRLRSGAGFREARATAGSFEERDARAALERALVLARVREPDEELAPLGGAVDVPETAAARPTLDHSFAEKAAWIGLAQAACAAAGLAPSGLVRTTAWSRALVNSAGRELHGELSRARFSITASHAAAEAGSGSAEVLAPDVEQLDVEAAVRRAVDKARRGARPRPIEPGEHTVVLEPRAVSALLLFLGEAFGARAVAEHESFLCAATPARFAPELEIGDDPSDPRNPGFLFDGEGTPTRRTLLVERGRPLGPVSDARWARRLGIENTGHGAAQPSSEGPRPRRLVVAPGAASLAELVAGVESGLFVSQLHYANRIEARGLTLTGTTRGGTFRIAGGEVGEPVRDLRFTQSLVAALARLTGVGADPEAASALFEGIVVAPAVRIDGFRFTSGGEA